MTRSQCPARRGVGLPGRPRLRNPGILPATLVADVVQQRGVGQVETVPFGFRLQLGCVMAEVGVADAPGAGGQQIDTERGCRSPVPAGCTGTPRMSFARLPDSNSPGALGGHR